MSCCFYKQNKLHIGNSKLDSFNDTINSQDIYLYKITINHPEQNMSKNSQQNKRAPKAMESLVHDLPYTLTGKTVSKKQLNAYYRSRVYTSQTGINSLVTAAQPILSLLDRIQSSTKLPEAKSLHHKLMHELQAFETYALSFTYPEDFVIVGRFILCMTLDDILEKLSWPENDSWNDYKFIPPPAHDKQAAEEGVFVILERIKQNPSEYIDLLELVYLCLSLGFEGKYRHLPNGKNELDAIIEALYEIIRQQRGDLKDNLLMLAPPLPKAPLFNFHHAVWVFFIFTGCILVALYISFNYMLNLNINSLLHDLQQILQQLEQINY